MHTTAVKNWKLSPLDMCKESQPTYKNQLQNAAGFILFL